MKKILFLLLTFTLLSSCTECNNQYTYKNNISNIDQATHFEYNGHKYIMFMLYGGTSYTNQSGVVHDPDCSCHIQN